MKSISRSSALRLAAFALTFGWLTSHVIATDGAHLPARAASVGLLRVSVRDQVSGRALPARIRVVEHKPFGATSVHYAPRGELERELAPGSYRVVVTHGPAWSVAEQTLSIAVGDVSALQAELRREVAFGDYTACDLHLHTQASPDSDFARAERVASVLSEDLGFAVITDHNEVTDLVEELEQVGVIGVPGVEVTTWDPEFGHFNAFPVRERPLYKRTNERDLLQALHAAGEPFVQINHPRLEHHIGYFALSGFDRDDDESALPQGFDGIEVWNGYELSSVHERDEVFRDWLALLHRGVRVVATGGSDSHKRGRMPFAGYPRTYVRTARGEALELDGAIRALKRGAAFVTNGPFIELSAEGARSGDELRMPRSRRVQVRVEVAAPAWMELSEVELWAGTQRVASLPLAAGDTAAQARLLVPDEARTLVATVRGNGSMEPLLGDGRSRPYAFTNPIWIARP